MNAPQALSPSERDAERYSAEFLRAILVGSAIAIPVLFAVMTLGFTLGGHTFVDAVGISALPAFFCGPFIGGLFSTTLVHEPAEHEEPAEVAPASPAPADVQDRAA